MTQKIINIGTGVNTKDGDMIRDAMNKINQNFTELFNLGGNGGTTSTSIGSVPPMDPQQGNLWFDTQDGKLYIYYDNSWVDTSPAVGTNALIYVNDTAPSDPVANELWFNTADGKIYIRYSNTWIDTSVPATNSNQTGDIGFSANHMFRLGGLDISNKDASHNPTARITFPANGPGDINIETLYGSTTIGTGLNNSIDNTWTFGTDGNLVLPIGGIIKNSDGSQYGGGAGSGNIDATGNLTVDLTHFIGFASEDPNWAIGYQHGQYTKHFINGSIDVRIGQGAYGGTNNDGFSVGQCNGGVSIMELNGPTTDAWFRRDLIVNRTLITHGVEDNATAAVDFFESEANNHVVRLSPDWTLKIQARAGGGNEGHLHLQAGGYGTRLQVNGNGSTVQICATDGSQVAWWEFDKTGKLTMPNGIEITKDGAIQWTDSQLTIKSSSTSDQTVGAILFDPLSSFEPVSISVRTNTNGGYQLWSFGSRQPNSGYIRWPDGTQQTTAWTGNTDEKIKIGELAGSSNQGLYAISIGKYAGVGDQGTNGIAIGYGAGSNQQGINGIGIGSGAGNTNQGQGAIAIGGGGSGGNDQGTMSIAIGYNAGQTSQAANTIILSASGSPFNGIADQTNSFYVNPIRNDNTATKSLVYNTTTKEVTYGDRGAINVDGNIVLTAGTAVFTFGTDGGVSFPGTLDVEGATTFNGDITFNGNVTLPGTINQISGNSGEYFGNPVTGVGALYAGKTGYTPVADTIFQTTGYVNGYIQNNMENTHPGNQASADQVITADNGTDTTGYIDMGMASSGWDGTQSNSLGSAVLVNDGYLYVQNGTGTAGGHLILGATTSGKKVKILAGGVGSSSIVADFSENGFNLSTGGITFPDSSVQTTAMLRGYTGSTGAGYTGSAGPSGYDGSRGYTGSSGTNGYTGSAGSNGYTGSAGSNGYTGSAGSNGYTGSAGTNGYTGSVGYVGSQGIAGNNLSNITIILDNVAPSTAYNGVAVTEWSAAFTGQGGQLLVRADITAYTTSSTSRNWYLKKNGVTVETGQFFYNATSTHMTLPTLQYIDTSGSTSAATWSISLGTGLIVDAQDRASISITEYTGLTGLTVSGLINSSYLLAQNSIDQNSVTQNTAVIFQTTLNSNGTLINKNSNTQITLTAGQTYKLEAVIRRFTSSSTWGAFRWWDLTNSTWVGVEAFGETATSGSAVGSTGIATLIVSPNANTTYELRQTTVNTITVSALYATIEITQINPSVSLSTISAITASGDLSGRYLISTNATGDEGGEIQLAKPPNATISGGITVDAYQNKIRFFEQGGTARGVSIDLSKAPAGVGGEITYKASNYVNAGTFVTLDNIKATLTSSGQRGLSLATTTGTITATLAGTYAVSGGGGASSSNGTISVTTSASTSHFSWNFSGQGDMSTYVLNDITNSRVYRITLIIGGGYSNNFISIERL